jgi:predicted phosphoribosyltransferase/predicted alpha/beta-hydrolase family hydrolase
MIRVSDRPRVLPWRHHWVVHAGGVTVFQDRAEAGRRLAPLLEGERAPGAVVVGLARGGVVVAGEVGRELGLPVDALAVRKVGHPWQPEYAIGAVTPRGGCYVRARDGLTDEQVLDAVAGAERRAEALDRVLHDARPPLPVSGRPVILVDDGLATGATMTAAVRWARAHGASRVVVAVPVGAPETIARLEREADVVVAFEAPAELGAVGAWYRDFRPVDDRAVVTLLEQGASPRAGTQEVSSRAIQIPCGPVALPGDLTTVPDANGIVVFAHGSGSSRRSPRNLLVAGALQEAGLGTLLFDLLTAEEAADRANVFDVPLLAARLDAAHERAAAETGHSLPVGYFGASTGAAAALWTAGAPGAGVGAVVSRGGRPDLAAPRLGSVTAPTLLLVGSHDEVVLDLNREAARALACEHELVVVPGASHLFEEPGALELVVEHATRWFTQHLGSAGR